MESGSSPLLLVTGFGPYEEVEENPSGRLALRLDAEPPEGVELVVRVLPVSFRGAPSELDLALEALRPRVPDGVLSLGLDKKGRVFRVERRATTSLEPGRRDVLGLEAEELALAPGDDLVTSVDAEEIAATLRRAGPAEARVSDDAGGFVCERLYRHALERSLEQGFAALFLHVPPFERIALGVQLRALRAAVAALARRVTV